MRLLVEGYRETSVTIRRNQLVIIGLFVIFFVFEISLLVATDGYPQMYEQTESYSVYRSAKNLFDYGIINLKFLDDCSVSPSEEAHPYYYTHHPNFPIIIIYILMKLGVSTMPYHILIMIVIFGVALFYMYLTVKEYTGSEQTALLVLAVSVFSYSSVLLPGLNILRGWTWFVLFAPLYHFKKYASNKRKIHFFAGLVFYFFTMYYDYTIALYFTLVFFLLKVFGFYEKVLWKHFLGYMLLGTIPPFLLHKTFVIWAVGFNIFLQDIILAISNRVFGNPVWTEAEIKELFASKGIVCNIGVGGRDNKHVFDMIGRIVGDTSFLFGRLNLLIPIILFFVGGIILLLRKIKSIVPLQAVKLFERSNGKAIKFFIAFFVPLLLLINIRYVVTFFFSPVFGPLIVFPVTIGLGVFLSTVITNFSTSVMKRRKIKLILIGFLLVFLVGQFIHTQYIHLTKTIPVKPMPGYKVLPKYKNHSFATNMVDTYIYYFTNEWAKVLWVPMPADIRIFYL